MACGLPGGAQEPAARPELDEGCGQQDKAVDVRHGQRAARPEHERHYPGRDRDRDRDDRPDAEIAQLGGPLARLRARRADWQVKVVSLVFGRVSNVVARRLDRTHQLGAPGPHWVEADRRPFGGQVHVGIDYPVRFAQVALDAVDAGRTGHALDGQRQLDGRG